MNDMSSDHQPQLEKGGQESCGRRLEKGGNQIAVSLEWANSDRGQFRMLRVRATPMQWLRELPLTQEVPTPLGSDSGVTCTHDEPCCTIVKSIMMEKHQDDAEHCIQKDHAECTPYLDTRSIGLKCSTPQGGPTTGPLVSLDQGGNSRSPRGVDGSRVALFPKVRL